MNEPQALARLAFDEVGRAVGGIGGMHQAIAARAFGSRAGPVRLLHDTISAGVYGAVRGGALLVGRGAALVPGGVELSAGPRGAGAIAAITGLIGDQLEREDNPLAQPMAVRVDGRPADASAFSDGGPRLVVFLHGLMETEFAWGEDPYGARLQRELGITPVYVRYNSGRHVSENGASLAALMQDLVDGWPVEVEEIALVGHSMGGLVARSACHQGEGWTERVRHVVSLGSPHLGAPLAQGVHWAAAAFDVLPETRAFGGLLRRRSAGIRDLRYGSLVDEDWHGQHPDALRARACAEVPLLPHATHCFVTATVTSSPRHPLGRLLGDALVLTPSGSGRGRTRRIDFAEEDGLHLGGVHHLALLNHRIVYVQLRDWLWR